MKVIVAQRGSREHFLAARALYRSGRLAGLVTDWYVPWGAGLAVLTERVRLNTFSRALRTKAADLPRELVKAFYFQKLRSKAASLFSRDQSAYGEAHLRSD